MKRLIVCCDGTWQSLNSDYPSNVAKIAQAIETDPKNSTNATPKIYQDTSAQDSHAQEASESIEQMVFYDPGIGTEHWWDKLPGGAFGIGIDKNIQDSYRFLCENYEPGDEIYLFGFSRGAYTVRSLAGLISKCGLLDRKFISAIKTAYNFYREKNPKKSDVEAKEFRERYSSTWQQKCLNTWKEKCLAEGKKKYSRSSAPITCLGCWDTVGSVGIPNLIDVLPLEKWFNSRLEFHDTTLSDIIGYAFHAIAIDEIRPAYDVTHMERPKGVIRPHVEEVWFPGGHGCVGGGTKKTRELSEGALKWMIERIEKSDLGLQFNPDNIIDIDIKDGVRKGIHPDPTIKFDEKNFGLSKFSWSYWIYFGLQLVPKIQDNSLIWGWEWRREIPDDLEKEDLDPSLRQQDTDRTNDNDPESPKKVYLDLSLKNRWAAKDNYKPFNLKKYEEDLNVLTSKTKNVPDPLAKYDSTLIALCISRIKALIKDSTLIAFCISRIKALIKACISFTQSLGEGLKKWMEVCINGLHGFIKRLQDVFSKWTPMQCLGGIAIIVIASFVAVNHPATLQEALSYVKTIAINNKSAVLEFLEPR